MKKFIKNNVKLVTLLLILIVLGIISATFALKFGATDLELISSKITVNVRYEKDNENNNITSLTSSGELTPVTLDTSSISDVLNSSDVVKYKFWISGSSTNPNDSIYDISLNAIAMDCELKNTYFKWVLYKNGNLLYSGNFSPTFDVMNDNRMILTTTQQDLNTTEDEYLLVLYIEDSCSDSDISSCVNAVDQSSMLGRNFSFNVGIETTSKSKKINTRTTGTEVSCVGNNESVNKPVCNNDLIYNGASQNLLSAAVPTGVTINQSVGTNVGEYIITAKLNSGYKWADNEGTEDYIFGCKINKRNITISTQNQVGSTFVSSPSKVDVSNLVIGHSINSIHLGTIGATGGDVIIAGNAIIYDSDSNDVTNNYTINYQSTGKIVEE